MTWKDIKSYDYINVNKKIAHSMLGAFEKHRYLKDSYFNKLYYKLRDFVLDTKNQ